jgi:glutathione S-transferase
MKVRLFGSRSSPFVEKVLRGLWYKGFEVEVVGVRSPSDFKRWSPQTRKMPALELGGERISDSTFILRALEKAVPEPPLWSRDPAVAAQQRLLEDWADEALYFNMLAIAWNGRWNRPTAKYVLADAASFIRTVGPLVVGRQNRNKAREQGMGKLSEEVLLRELGNRLDDLVALLGASPFFYSDRLGAADLAVYGQLCALCRPVCPPTRDAVMTRAPLAAFKDRVEAACPDRGAAHDGR